MLNFRAKKWLNITITGVSHACLLIELGPICISMAASLWFKSCEDRRYLKVIMEVYGKTFTALGPKEENQACFVGYFGFYVCDLLYVFNIYLICLKYLQKKLYCYKCYSAGHMICAFLWCYGQLHVRDIRVTDVLSKAI